MIRKDMKWAVELLSNRCATCKHWDGNHELMIDRFYDRPISIDSRPGWPASAECNNSIEWGELHIHGDATAVLTVEAGSGCVLHEMFEFVYGEKMDISYH